MSILSRVQPEDIKFGPQPYVYKRNALETDFYAELAAAFPSLEKVAGNGPFGNNKAHLLSARDVIPDKGIPEIWREFFSYHCSNAFFQDMLRFWQPVIDQEYPDLEQRFHKPRESLTTTVRNRSKEKTAENLSADMALDCQFGINSPVTEPGSVRGPHVDKPYKLYAALLYFRQPEDESTGGNLELYRPRSKDYYFDSQLNIHKRFIEKFTEVPYEANTLVMWLNTPISLHGVSPRSVTPVSRRYVNFLAECYTLPTEGFFPIPQRSLNKASSLIKQMFQFRHA